MAGQKPDGLWLRLHHCGRPCSRVLCPVLAGLKPAKARRSAWFSRSLSGSGRRGQGRPKARQSAWSKARRSALFSRSVSGSGVVKAGQKPDGQLGEKPDGQLCSHVLCSALAGGVKAGQKPDGQLGQKPDGQLCSRVLYPALALSRPAKSQTVSTQLCLPFLSSGFSPLPRKAFQLKQHQLRSKSERGPDCTAGSPQDAPTLLILDHVLIMNTQGS